MSGYVPKRRTRCGAKRWALISGPGPHIAFTEWWLARSEHRTVDGKEWVFAGACCAWGRTEFGGFCSDQHQRDPDGTRALSRQGRS